MQVEGARTAQDRRARALARLDATARALRDERADTRTPDPADDDVPIALVPSTDEQAFPMFIPGPYAPPSAPLPRRRRRALHAHLRRIAAAAADLADGPEASASPADPPPAVADAEGALLGAACAMCGGRCCRHGGEQAYLTPLTVRRWLDAHPGAGPEAAVTAYAAHLPPTSVAGSCVYHTSAGCALPRAMRSSTCNTFLCDGLTALRAAYAARAAAGRPVRRAFLAVIEDDEVARWGFAETGGAA